MSIIISILLGIAALALIINIFAGFVKMALAGKIISAVVAVICIIILVRLIGWVA